MEAENDFFAHEEENGERDGAGEEGGEETNVGAGDDDDVEEEEEEDENDEGEEEEAEEEEEDEEDEDADVIRLNPELSWEMSQAIAFRYAKKRTLQDLSLIARAELGKLGLTDGMLVSGKGRNDRSFARG